ncbi:MAG: Selenide, water dikinase [Betaproteobacteria bacterium ADurb.Bin341]|nr:MAG: Selenide, water dikinase [Betaproteobacteria bacterium ADurb.Bin341]
MFEFDDPNLLVGPQTSDDAGVYRIADDCALVETTDIITPLVDDPFLFGSIAAANALSDVYAMGGRPVTAMNLVFCPACGVPLEALRAIMAGGAAKLREAGVCLVGGHSIEDDELKYGLAVTGLVHPQQVVRNSTAKAGDRLILTKPLGTGLISTGIKADMADAQAVEEACRWMTTLNALAAKLMLECGAHACTDITGFGLIGHATEMARGAGLTYAIKRSSIPVMAGVAEMIDCGLIPGGLYRNRDHYAPMLKADSQLEDDLLPLFDPQTSGGLLIALADEDATAFLQRTAASDCFAVEIGHVVPKEAYPLLIR